MTKGNMLCLNADGCVVVTPKRYGLMVTPEEAIELGRLLTAAVERIDRQCGKYDVTTLLMDVWSSCGASVEVPKGGQRYGGSVLPIGDGAELFLRVNHFNHQYKGTPLSTWQLATYCRQGRCKAAGIMFDGHRVSRHVALTFNLNKIIFPNNNDRPSSSSSSWKRTNITSAGAFCWCGSATSGKVVGSSTQGRNVQSCARPVPPAATHQRM